MIPTFPFSPELLKEIRPESETCFREVSSANRTSQTNQLLLKGVARTVNIVWMSKSLQATRWMGIGTCRVSLGSQILLSKQLWVRMFIECCLPAIVDQLDSSKLIRDRITTHLVKQLLHRPGDSKRNLEFCSVRPPIASSPIVSHCIPTSQKSRALLRSTSALRYQQSQLLTTKNFCESEPLQSDMSFVVDIDRSKELIHSLAVEVGRLVISGIEIRGNITVEKYPEIWPGKTLVSIRPVFSWFVFPGLRDYSKIIRLKNSS